MPPRFLQLADVAEVLNISAAQTYALVRSGELPAIKVGGRGQWRVEASELEGYIQRMYSETREFVQAHPFGVRPRRLSGQRRPDHRDAGGERHQCARPCTATARAGPRQRACSARST